MKKKIQMKLVDPADLVSYLWVNSIEWSGNLSQLLHSYLTSYFLSDFIIIYTHHLSSISFVHVVAKTVWFFIIFCEMIQLHLFL